MELEWNGRSYTATLTDHNRVLSDYSFSANEDGISFSVSGNQFIITATDAPSDSVRIIANKVGSSRRGIITWTDGTFNQGSGEQDVITYAQSVSDPVQALEACTKVRRLCHGHHAECGRPASVPHGKNDAGKLRVYCYAQSGIYDRLELAKLLNISDTQLSYITNVDAGHGLIKVGSSLVPFANKFPKNTKLYKLVTTKPGEGA